MEGKDMSDNIRGAFANLSGSFKTAGPVREPVVYLPQTGQVVRTIGSTEIPEAAKPEGILFSLIS